MVRCEPNDKITVKGIAYPIVTYTVLDLIDTIHEEQEHIKAQLKGFKLAIDFQKLNYNDKLYAREMLEKAMAQLDFKEDP